MKYIKLETELEVKSQKESDQTKDGPVVSFYVSVQAPVDLHEYNIIHDSLRVALEQTAVGLGLTIGPPILLGRGATAADVAVNFILEFYYNHEAWFYLMKVLGLLKVIKNIIKLYKDVHYRLMLAYHRAVAEGGQSSRLKVEIEARNEYEKFYSDSQENDGIIRMSQNIFMLLPTFERSLDKILSNLPIEFNISVYTKNRSLYVGNYISSSKKIELRTKKFLRNVKVSKRINHIHFYKWTRLNIQRCRVFSIQE